MKPKDLRVFSGDFVPYTDRWSEFWTGYFTTRPWMKSLGNEKDRLSRVMETMLFSCLSDVKTSCQTVKTLKQTKRVRKIVLNFLHHDLITGTSREDVIESFSSDLESIKLDLRTSIIPTLIKDIIGLEIISKKVKTEHSDFLVINDDVDPYQGPISLSPVYFIEETTKCFSVQQLTNSGWVALENGPVFVENSLVVDARLEPFTVTVFRLFEKSSNCELPKTSENKPKSFIENHLFKWRLSQEPKNLLTSILNDRFQLSFGFELFGTYTKIPESLISDPSGAYIFTYDGRRSKLAQKCDRSYEIKSTLFDSYNSNCNFVSLRTSLYHSKSAYVSQVAEIDLNLNIKPFFMNDEFAIVFKTNLETSGIFYTDLNGMFPVKRKYRSKLSLPGNVYPISTYVQITDGKTWVTIIPEYSHGVTSTRNGEIVLFLDRIHEHDDWRGLGEQITDNRNVSAKIWISISTNQAEGIWLARLLNGKPIVIPEIAFKAEPISSNLNLQFGFKNFFTWTKKEDNAEKSGCSQSLIQTWADVDQNTPYIILQKLPFWKTPLNWNICQWSVNQSTLLQSSQLNSSSDKKFSNRDLNLYNIDILKVLRYQG